MTRNTLDRGNHLLEALRTDEYERLKPHLELVSLVRGQVLGEPGRKITHIYFPVSAIVSLVCVMQNGESAEIALTGCEGLVGATLFMGGDTPPSRAVVQSDGDSYRIGTAVMKAEFALGGTLQGMSLKYLLALVVQMAQTAACNGHHKLEQRLCRWLLLGLDRSSSDELRMTQEAIASMLGVRREGVTTAAGKLQADGVIRWSRGRIRVLDRRRLEQRACECYAVVKDEYRRLLPVHAEHLTPFAA